MKSLPSFLSIVPQWGPNLCWVPDGRQRKDELWYLPSPSLWCVGESMKSLVFLSRATIKKAHHTCWQILVLKEREGRWPLLRGEQLALSGTWSKQSVCWCPSCPLFLRDRRAAAGEQAESPEALGSEVAVLSQLFSGHWCRASQYSRHNGNASVAARV